MRIAIDARELAPEPTGVGRFLAEVLSVWRQTSPHHEYVLLGAGERLGTTWEQRTLPRLVRASGADVLFSPAYTGPVRCPVPMVLAVHDISFVAHPEWFSWREGARRRTITALAARVAAAVVTISTFSKREIAARLGVPAERIAVVYPGIALGPVIEARPPDTDRRILYAGSIFNRRHVPELLTAYDRLAARHDNLRLNLIGHNRTYPHQDIEGLIASLPSRASIAATPWVDEAHLVDLHRHAAAFVFLSEYEGFGLTPMEALGHGVPPLLLDTPVAREVCGDAAMYVASPEPAVVSDALEALLFDVPVRQAILSHAQGVLARYSWAECATRLLRVIESVA